MIIITNYKIKNFKKLTLIWDYLYQVDFLELCSGPCIKKMANTFSYSSDQVFEVMSKPVFLDWDSSFEPQNTDLFSQLS